MAGALGVVITTDVPMSGQHAQPVYVDDTLPIVGPSRAIVVTTGEVPQMGGPPLAVRLAPAGTPATGPGMYVYVVPGGGSLGGSIVAPSSLLTGLVGYWKMDEVSGNRADSSGSGFTLTDNNTVASNTGKVSNAADFLTANSESLSIASNATLQAGPRDFFFDGWFFPTTMAGVQFLIEKGTASAGAGHEYGLFFNGSTLQIRMSAGASSATLSIAASLGANTWYYVAFWWEQAAGKIWGQLNNNAAVSAALAGTLNTSAGVLSLGAFNAASSFYTGRIDEVGRWNRILTGSEILARYNGGAGNSYPF